jgi:hypothetical protein
MRATVSRTSDYVYMLSGMIYNGAEDERSRNFWNK